MAPLESVVDCVGGTPLVRLNRCFQGNAEVLAKLELLNPGGSIKDRPARYIIEQALATGDLRDGGVVIESSSGNFGIALAMLACVHGLRLICVVDPNITPTNLALLRELGAQIEMVTELDENGGYLLSRLERVGTLADEHPGAFRVNQHTNELNWRCHYESLGAELMEEIDAPPDLFVAAVSTTATLVGVGMRLRELWPSIWVVAVDAEGSVLLGGEGGPRAIPGLGASRADSFSAEEVVDEVVRVGELEATTACKRLLRAEGILAGGSSGAVIAAIEQLIPSLAAGSRIVTVLPDRGERYIEPELTEVESLAYGGQVTV
jgi:N-(2-amino-2-carboxyethyl)-L-glutamate synthase